MKNLMPLSLRHVFAKDFNISLFVSFCLLGLYHYLPETVAAYDQSGLYRLTFIPAFNGFLTGAVMLLLNHYFSHRRYTSLYYTEDKSKLLFVAFLAGYCGYLISFSVWTTYLVTLAVIYFSVAKIRSFINKLSGLLAPGKLPSVADVGSFFNFFISLIISFAVINLSLNELCRAAGLPEAFNFNQGIAGVVDAVYFSAITMTTVGYGDTIPQTTIARVFVSFECITSYLMLGVMIGLLTKGIKPRKY